MGIATRFPSDAGISSDRRVVFFDGFERANWRNSWLEGNVRWRLRDIERVEGKDVALVGNAACKFVLKAGQLYGSMLGSGKLKPGWKTIHMRWFDHLLGFVFGSVRGAILGMLILAVLTLILPEENVLLARSRGYQAASGPLRVLAHLLPEKAEEAFHRRHEIYRQLVPEKRKKDEKKDDKQPFGKGIPLRL